VDLFYHPPGSDHILTEEEAHHARVLRLAIGDRIMLVDGCGKRMEAQLTTNKKEFRFSVTKEEVVARPPYHIHLGVAPTKNMDRMEWLVEKCTELGVQQISFMQCDRSERKTVNLDRLGKIALSAMKQSQQAWLPELTSPADFHEVLLAHADQRFIGHVDRENQLHLQKLIEPGKRYLILIGPEGDFSPEELMLANKRGFATVALGPNRLRTETAAMVACALLCGTQTDT
jgi:16S rRNA (uracil1498-N3)-methyltransferase